MTHASGLPEAIDRSINKPEQRSVVFYGARPLLQGGELNELQTIGRARMKRIGNLIAADGNRVSGAEIFADVEGESLSLTAGEVYADGDVIAVAAATLAGVSMVGRTEVGVRLITTYITHEDDADLLGQVPGSLAEGEPGAAREIVTASWAVATDGGAGVFYPVFVMQDGTVLDQTPPPALDGIMNAIAIYDYDAHANYIVEGHRVTTLGKSGTDQVFSIEQGVANVRGRKITRHAALRHSQTEAWDIGAVDGETHIYSTGITNTITAGRFPINTISQILLTKERTVTVTRGAGAGGADALPNSSVIAIVEVKQGGTTFVPTTDYLRIGDSVDWAPAGDEPAGGSSYNVTYRYRDSVVADSFTDTEIVVSGGADGGDVIITYTYKLPRIDLLCLAPTGEARYVKGVSGNVLPPAAPSHLLKLAEVHNDWMGVPSVTNNGTYNYTFDQLQRAMGALDDLIRLTMLERSKSSIDQREPVAKRNMFVDPLIDDTYRDAGEAQTAAIFDGMMMLPITPTFYDCGLAAPVMLDWVEEVIVAQELATSCETINPYQNFTPMPAAMALAPAADFWTQNVVEWTSPATREFNRGFRFDGGPLVATSNAANAIGNRTQQAEFLRQIEVTAQIAGFGAGENLATLTFDGVNVKPAGVQTADGSGDLSVAFTIPANIPAGSKTVEATGAGGSMAQAIFTGQGIIDVTVMQRITTVERWAVNQSSGGGSGDDDDTELDRFGRSIDPQAQIFAPPQSRHIVGIDIKLCAIGDDSNNVIVQQVAVDNGDPTADVVAEAFVPMAGVVAGWLEARYKFPALSRSDRLHAFVVKTDDGVHAIAAANLGDFDAVAQSYVTKHPYPVGPRLSSVNAQTWTAHQNSAITFRLVAAKFTSNTKTVALGEHDLVDCSDLQIRASVDLPSAQCSVVFEVVRAGGQVLKLLPNQVLQLNEFITETVTVRAKLTGTEKLSPVLYGPVVLVAGEIATTATYVSRAFNFGTAIRLTEYYKVFLPSGASVTAEYDLADDDWHELPLDSTEALAQLNWTERKHEVTPITGAQGRIKLTLNGGPAARLLVGDLGAAIF